MPDLITLDEAKTYLRVDDDGEDSLIATLIRAASDAVSAYADAWDGTGDVPALLKLAVLTRVTAAYDNREALTEPKGEHAYILPYRTLDL